MIATHPEARVSGKRGSVLQGSCWLLTSTPKVRNGITSMLQMGTEAPGGRAGGPFAREWARGI